MIVGGAGGAATLTVALPVPAATVPQLVLNTLATEYFVVVCGLTVRTAGLAWTFWKTPSDHVRFQGGMPVSTAWMVVEEPSQIALFPLTVAVGGHPSSAGARVAKRERRTREIESQRVA